jgi:hypothetical protein
LPPHGGELKDKEDLQLEDEDDLQLHFASEDLVESYSSQEVKAA